MAERKPTRKGAQRTAGKASEGFTDEERAAMRERAKEAKAAARRGSGAGMPAYAKDGAVVCFFQPSHRFKTRYATLGFSDKAKLDDGDLWPAAYALKELTEATEARIAALVRQAVG